MRVQKLLLLFFLFTTISLPAQSNRIDSMETLIEKDIPPPVLLSTLNKLFEEFFFRGDSIKAAYYADLLTDKAIEMKAPTFKMQGQINKAYSHNIRLIWPQAKPIIESVLVEAKKTQDSLIIGQCYNYLGFEEVYFRRIAAGIDYFEKAFALLLPTSLEKSVSPLIQINGCALRTNDKAKVIESSSEFLRIAKKAGNPIVLFRAYQQKAHSSYVIGNYSACTDAVAEAIKIAETHNIVSKGLVRIYLMTADLYLFRNDSTKALYYADKGYEISKQVNNISFELTAANSLAYFHIVYNKDLSYVKELLGNALQLANKFNLTSDKAKLHSTLGFLYEKQEAFTLAQKHYIESILLYKTKGKTNTGAQAALSKLIDKESDNTINLDSLLTSDTTKLMDALPLKLEIFQTKMNLAEKSKNHKKALFWAKKINVVSQAIQNEKLKISIKEQLLSHELETKAKELTIQKELVKTTDFKNNILSFTIILTLILLGLLGYLFYAKQKYNQVILVKNKVIAQLNETLINKNKLLATKNNLLEKEVIDYISFQRSRDHQLKELQADIMNASKQDLQDPLDWKIIQNKFNGLISSQDDWQMFKQKIEKIYPNFFQYLILKHPNLNQREQTHCAYLLIGLSIRQVAESLFISTKTVESARYRLKKKMGLLTSENLPKHIKQISKNGVAVL